MWDWLLMKDMDSSLVILALSVIPRLPRSILGRCDLIRSSQANERRLESIRGRGTKGPLPRPWRLWALVVKDLTSSQSWLRCCPMT